MFLNYKTPQARFLKCSPKLNITISPSPLIAKTVKTYELHWNYFLLLTLLANFKHLSIVRVPQVRTHLIKIFTILYLTPGRLRIYSTAPTPHLYHFASPSNLLTALAPRSTLESILSYKRPADTTSLNPEKLGSTLSSYSCYISYSFFRKTFDIFIKLNFYLPSTLFKTYSSPKQLYFSAVSGSISVGFLAKIFNFWQVFYSFFTSLYYFKLPVLYFTSNFFRREVLSLNWTYFLHVKYAWKYVQPFFFLLHNKILPYSNYIFASLRKLNFNTAFIGDVSYHQNTLHYLSRAGFYIIGLVPSTSRHYFLNFIIPIATNNFISQFFFLRLILQVKLRVNMLYYKSIRA